MSKKSTKSSKTAKTPKAATAKAAAAKPAPAKKASKPAAEAKPKRLSALDAAAQVLQKAKQPMRAQEMITAMSDAGLWSSPAGKTPHATLYAAVLREINAKGKEARFKKTDRGQFEFNA